MFLWLGLYFIHKGDVWERYRLQRTNYATFEEEISEIPTIVTCVRRRDLNLGTDYNFSMKKIPPSGSKIMPTTNLTNTGSYKVKLQNDQTLEIEFENELYGWPCYKITPNLPQEISPKNLGTLALTCTFSETINSSRLASLITDVRLTSDNNSVSGAHLIETTSLKIEHHDGKLKSYQSLPGNNNEVAYRAHKFNILSANCRKQSFNELLFQQVAANISICLKPCRDGRNFGHKLNNILRHLPLCKNEKEKACFNSVARAAYDKFRPIQPCTRIEYEAEALTHKIDIKYNQVRFLLHIEKPEKVKVHEEYLIYDMVAMVGAIGGTMGLCIGFSFNDFCSLLLDYLELFIVRVKNRNSVISKTVIVQEAQTIDNAFERIKDLECILDGFKAVLLKRMDELEMKMSENCKK